MLNRVFQHPLSYVILLQKMMRAVFAFKCKNARCIEKFRKFAPSKYLSYESTTDMKDMIKEFLRVFLYAFAIVLGLLTAYCLVVFVGYHLIDWFG